MKFYEKIIGIDKASSHGLMTITFNSGFFEFDKGLKIAGDTTITGSLSSTSSKTTSFNINTITLTEPSPGYWKYDYNNNANGLILDLAGNKLYSKASMFLGTNTYPFTNGYINSLNSSTILPTNQINSTIGNMGSLWKYIFTDTIYATNADITNANIINITNATKLGQSSTIITTNREAYIGGIEIYPTLTRTSPNIVTKQTPTSLISGNVPGFTNPTMHIITGRATKAASSLYLYINHNTGKNYDDFHIFTFQRSYTASNYPLYLAPSNDQPSTFTLALKGPGANQDIEYDYLLIYYS